MKNMLKRLKQWFVTISISLTKKLIRLIPMACVWIVITIIVCYSFVKTYQFISNPLPHLGIWTAQTITIQEVRAEEVKELPMKLWIFQEINKAGLDINEADCIIKNESGWREDSIGATYDYGVWQINIQHKDEIKVRDMLDYKKATRWAINKRLHDGNWSAWVQWNNICKFIYE